MKYNVDKDKIVLNMEVDETSGCWEWQAYRNDKGYGLVRYKGRLWRAHRLSYHLFVKPPCELCVLHSCDNPSCVNPDHLWTGTQLDNMADRGRKGRTSRLSGEDCGSSILTNDEVISIKRGLRDGVLQGPLAVWFGVSRATISKISTGKNWGHLEIPSF